MGSLPAWRRVLLAVCALRRRRGGGNRAPFRRARGPRLMRYQLRAGDDSALPIEQNRAPCAEHCGAASSAAVVPAMTGNSLLRKQTPVPSQLGKRARTADYARRPSMRALRLREPRIPVRGRKVIRAHCGVGRTARRPVYDNKPSDGVHTTARVRRNLINQNGSNYANKEQTRQDRHCTRSITR